MPINQNPFLAINRFGDELAVSALDVLTTVQPTPTATGNTTNLNCAFKDASGNTWIVDSNGDAILAGTVFKELNRFYADPNGLDTNTGANEAPFLTAQAAVNALGQGDTAVLNEGVYGAVTMATQNTTLSGASNGYSGLVQIASLTATAAGTSVRVEGITVTGAVAHTGTAPLYLNNVTVSGDYSSSSAGYAEIKDSRIQDGTITNTAGTLFIRDSLIGNGTFSTAGSVIAMRNVTIDAGDKVTIGAGVVYSLQDVVGEVEIDPAAVSVEQAVLAAGGTAAQAEGAVTSHFMQMRMHTPDTEASPTKVVTWDEATGELEISDLSAINTGAPVTTGTAAPTGTSTEGAIHLVTDDGTPTGTVLEQYIYDADSGVWIEMQRNAESLLKFGTAAPTANGDWDGEEFFVTSDGTSTGTVTAMYVYDKQTTTWVLRPSGSTSALWTTVTTNPTATGNTGTLPRFTYNSVTGDRYYVDSAGVARLVEAGTDVCNTVFFNSTTPSTATIFDTANPPVTNNDALKNLDCAVYIGTDGSIWSSNGTTYSTKTYSYATHHFETKTATALQTSVTLAKTPILGTTGKVRVSRNGIDITRAWTWVGAVGTYNSANNYSCTIDANDILQFEYEAL